MRKLLLVALMAVGLSAKVETFEIKTKEDIDWVVEIINLLHKNGYMCKLGGAGRYDLKDIKMQIEFFDESATWADEAYFIVGMKRTGDCVTPIEIRKSEKQGDGK